LSHTGELQLTDAQVVRLATIARREESRRQALRASRDSLRARRMTAPTPNDSAARSRRLETMMEERRVARERLQTQQRADLRDALAVLTPDQQARAWEMRAGGGCGARAGRNRGAAMGGRRGMREMPMNRRGAGGSGAPRRPRMRPDDSLR
jgi:hypothetical protein